MLHNAIAQMHNRNEQFFQVGFFKKYNYFTSLCRGLGLVGLALYMVD